MGVFVPKTDYFVSVICTQLSGAGGLRAGVGGGILDFNTRNVHSVIRASERERDGQTDRDGDRQRRREDAAVLVKVKCQCCLTGLKAPTTS